MQIHINIAEKVKLESIRISRLTAKADFAARLDDEKHFDIFDRLTEIKETRVKLLQNTADSMV